MKRVKFSGTFAYKRITRQVEINKKKKYHLVDLVIPMDQRVKMIEEWAVIPFEIGALWTALKVLEKKTRRIGNQRKN